MNISKNIFNVISITTMLTLFILLSACTNNKAKIKIDQNSSMNVTDSKDVIIWHIKAIHPDGKLLDVKAIDKDGNIYDVKAIDTDGTIMDIKAITADGEILDIRGVSQTENIINIKAINKKGEFYGVKAIAPKGWLNDVKGVKTSEENVEAVINGVEVYAHIKGLTQSYY